MEQSTAQSQTGESRRAYTRQEITLKALVHPDTGRSWLCNIKDFCRGGMFLVSEGVGSLQSSGCNPQRDDGVGIHFTVPTVEGEQQFRLQARVARVTADGNGIGVFFPDGMEQLALDTLEEFAPAAGGGPDDDQAVQSAQIIAIPEFKFNPDDAGQLLGELQTIVTDAVEQIGKSFFEDADKDLLEHAGYASDADQSRYFDAMTDLGQCKDGVTTAFSRAIEDHLENTLDAAVSLDQQPDDQPAGATSGLALVNIGQFESWLVLAEIISKLEFRFDLELEEMHAQLALIAGPWRNRKTLPVGPSVVARAFDEALNLVQVDQEVKLLLYRTFQDGLVPQLEKLYDAINKLLADSDMFPLLDELLAQQQRISSPAVGKGPTASGDVEPPQTAAETDVPGAEAAPSNGPAATPIKGNTPDRQRNIAESSYAEGYTASTRDVFEAATTLLNLKDQSRRGLGTGQGETDANPETYSPNEVTDALRELQRERSGTPIETNEIRDRLLNLLRWSEDGAQDKRIGDSEADAMDVVGNLVTSIREDKLLPEGVKDWVKRLELTLTKLATQDPGFFANQSKQPHPAMQVLDQLAKLGDTLDKGDDVNLESGGSEVDSLMRRVVDEFDGNPKIFHEVLEELNPLVDRQTRTYQGNLQRTVRVCEGQQRLSSARRDVVDEVEQRLSGRQLPQLILELLNPGWRNLLVHHHLRHGRDSESWKQNLEILEQLVDHLSGSVEPGSPDYVEASELLSAVETGLTSISFEPVRRAPLLRRISQALAGSGERDLVKLESGDCARALGLEDLVPETDPASEHDDPASQGEWSRWLDQARSLKVGDWLAATDDSDGREILSLAWIGEEHANFILVDAKGLKAREFTLRQLVQSLMDGTVVRLDEFNLPLTERASHHMLESLHNELAHQASHDGLTGLINRKEFENRLEKALVSARMEGQHHVVLYADLDQFKIVNNIAGHHAGDELLKIIAQKLRDELHGARGSVARLGGDEFGALIEQVTTETGVEIAHRQIDAIRNYRFDWEERHFSLSACVGVVSVDESVFDVNELMKNAETACYAAKDAGRNRIFVFEPDDTKVVHRTGVMERVEQIDRALEDDRLVLYFQRIIPIAANPPVHFEFLLRVLDEEGNVLPPADLINAAEAYNRMPAIDRWVVHNALQWIKSLGDEIDEIGHFSINLSGNSLNDDEFADFVLDELMESSVATSKICFEITETATIANRDHAVQFMNKMKVIGCQFALDDFGTGLSSYSYLRNMPVDYLKIDHIFVKDLDRSPGDYAVVKSINEIGHVMGKLTVAEGVENDDILELLHEIGVDFGQGYGIHKPEPIGKFKV